MENNVLKKIFLLIKQLQSSVEEAYAEYEKINGVLKEQLPQYIYLRVPFLDPILESLILFQDHLFVSMVQSYYPMESYVDRSLSVVEGYERKKDIVVPLLQEISILSKAPITSPNMGLLFVKMHALSYITLLTR